MHGKRFVRLASREFQVDAVGGAETARFKIRRTSSSIDTPCCVARIRRRS
jgi:hypothetical protein